MFNRYDMIADTIVKKTLAEDKIKEIIELHYAKNNLTEAEYNDLIELLHPVNAEYTIE